MVCVLLDTFFFFWQSVSGDYSITSDLVIVMSLLNTFLTWPFLCNDKILKKKFLRINIYLGPLIFYAFELINSLNHVADSTRFQQPSSQQYIRSWLNISGHQLVSFFFPDNRYIYLRLKIKYLREIIYGILILSFT